MKRRSISVLTVIFSCCLLIFACRKEITNVIHHRKNVPSDMLETAKIWYLQHLDVLPKKKAKKAPPRLTPFWKDAWITKTVDSSTLLVVPAPENLVFNRDFSIRRFFLFRASGNDISNGKIVELVGLKYDVNDNLDFLLKNYDQRSIAGFNGGIFQYDVNYKSIIRTTYENGSPSAKPASFSSQKGGKKKAKPLMLRTTNDCPIVYPEYIGLPDNIGEDCTVTLWHQTSYDLDGCLISDTYTFVSMTCPGSGSGSDTGSASASSSSGGGPEPPYGNGGGGDDDDDGFSFDSNLLLNNMNGTKPIAEYPDKCSGAQGIWTMATNNNKEVFGVMTADSQFMAVAMIGFEGGQFGGIYDEYGTEYYTYPDSLGLPSQTYSGMIHSAGQYFIPIIATIHTHNPCVVDGTDGVTNGNLSPEDIQLENNYTTINHYIIGCDALGKLNAGYNQAFLLATGTLSNTCSLIH